MKENLVYYWEYVKVPFGVILGILATNFLKLYKYNRSSNTTELHALIEVLKQSYKEQLEAYQNLHNDKIAQMVSTMQELMDRVTSAEEAEKECTKNNKELFRQVSELRKVISDREGMKRLIDLASPVIPLPMWIKDLNSVMIECNKFYEKAFLAPHGITAEEYVQKTDEEIWTAIHGKEVGAEIAKIFRDNDLIVILTKKAITINEEVEETYLNKWWFIKFPIMTGDIVVATGGMAIPKIAPKNSKK